jgi:hypothetical protein
MVAPVGSSRSRKMLRVDESEPCRRVSLIKNNGVLGPNTAKKAQDSLTVISCARAYDLVRRGSRHGPGDVDRTWRGPEGFETGLLERHKPDR